MLARDHRPRTFEAIVGQPVNCEVLRAIAKDPENSPRVLILRGSFGTGKTTSARVFARALNCMSKKGERPCGECGICASDINFSSFYTELDSSDVGTKEAIQSLKDDFFVTSGVCQYRVIVLDEFHLTSRPAQAALLKLLEDLPENLFIMFCTTDVDKILPTIRSRSVDLVFQPVGMEDLKKNLMRVVSKEGLQVPEDVIERICLYSRGHVRDSVMLLDTYAMLLKQGSVDTFLNHVRSSEIDLIEFLMAVKHGDKKKAQEQVGRLCSVPLDVLRADLHQVLEEALKLFATEGSTSLYAKRYAEMVSLWKGDLLRLMAFSTSEWATNSFNDDKTAQAFFWALFLSFGRPLEQATASDFRKR